MTDHPKTNGHCFTVRSLKQSWLAPKLAAHFDYLPPVAQLHMTGHPKCHCFTGRSLEQSWLAAKRAAHFDYLPPVAQLPMTGHPKGHCFTGRSLEQSWLAAKRAAHFCFHSLIRLSYLWRALYGRNVTVALNRHTWPLSSMHRQAKLLAPPLCNLEI